MCYYQTIGRNAKYEKNQKNGGIIPPVNDPRALHAPRPCGRCLECRKKRAREWQVRLYEDVKKNRYGKMVTLTLSNQSYKELYNEIPKTKLSRDRTKIIDLTPYDIDNEIATLAVKRFRERWRRKYKKSIRHWLVTELGHNGTENIHVHGIIWTKEKFSTIREKWGYGFIYPRKDEEIHNYVSERTVNYCVKYVQKIDFKHKLYRSLVLSSPGIGACYINDITKIKHRYQGEETVLTYKNNQGFEFALPKYYIEKLFTDDQREKLWMINEDKLIRWIGKTKINISKSKKHYFKVLKHHRELNKELGYGTNIPDGKRRKYEYEVRKVMQEARINAQEGPAAGTAGNLGSRTLPLSRV